MGLDWAERESALNLRHFALPPQTFRRQTSWLISFPLSAVLAEQAMASVMEKIFASPAIAPGTRPRRRRLQSSGSPRRACLDPKMGRAMSPILPISLLVFVLCIFGAMDGVLFQQLLFVGAAVAATILVCSAEAWSAREASRSEDDRGIRDLADY
jgi:hypothetical protein